MLFLSGENNILRLKLEQANKEHINHAEKHTHFSRVIYFFHIFTSENMKNTSVLACGKNTQNHM